MSESQFQRARHMICGRSPFRAWKTTVPLAPAKAPAQPAHLLSGPMRKPRGRSLRRSMIAAVSATITNDAICCQSTSPIYAKAGGPQPLGRLWWGALLRTSWRFSLTPRSHLFN